MTFLTSSGPSVAWSQERSRFWWHPFPRSLGSHGIAAYCLSSLLAGKRPHQQPIPMTFRLAETTERREPFTVYPFHCKGTLSPALTELVLLVFSFFFSSRRNCFSWNKWTSLGRCTEWTCNATRENKFICMLTYLEITLKEKKKF